LNPDDRKQYGRRLIRQSAKLYAAALLIAATAGLINCVYALSGLLIGGAVVLLVWARLA
jgi:hypothetical protein